MNQTTNTTASIDLAQLDRNQVLELMLKHDMLSQIGYRALLDGDSMDADLNLLTRLVALARRSLTSGAPAEPVAEVIEEPAFPGSGIMVRGVRFIDSTAKPGDKLYRAAPVHDAAAPSAEHTQWRNIQKAIRQVAEFCFGGPQQEGSVSMAAAYISVVNCLTAKDGVDLKLEPLSAGAAAKTDQAPAHETIVREGDNLVCTACGTSASAAGAGSEQAPARECEYPHETDKCLGCGWSASAAGAGSAQPRDTCAEMRALCSSCGGTGDVTSIDGEWRGECNCPAGIALTLDRLKIAAGNTHRENEELRAALARALSRDAGREEASTQKVQSINMQEAIAPQVQVADINSDPYFRHLLGRTFKSEAARQELATCVNTWHASRLERYRRSPPAVGLSNGRLLDLALLASLTGDPAKLIDYGRSVLSAATHPSPLLGASKILVGDIKMEGPSA